MTNRRNLNEIVNKASADFENQLQVLVRVFMYRNKINSKLNINPIYTNHHNLIEIRLIKQVIIILLVICLEKTALLSNYCRRKIKTFLLLFLMKPKENLTIDQMKQHRFFSTPF